MRTALTSALAVVLTTLLIGVTAGSAQAYTKSATYQKQMLTRTNQVREANDRVKLKTTTCLGGYADAWAKHMATKNSMTHRSVSSLTTIMKKCKLDGIAENIAFGYGTGTAVVNAWQKSPGHRANQLGKGYRHIGIGAFRDGDDRYYSVALYGNPA